MTRRLVALLCLALLCAAAPARAQVVTVASGEHPGFSRLVLRLGGLRDWRLGRTAQGYELWLAGPMPQFDLTGVYDRIPRTRLAAVGVDGVTGNLRLTLACDCHALPFEYRPGVVVIDLRDGPAPPGSSFERGLDGQAMAGLHRPGAAGASPDGPSGGPSDGQRGDTSTGLRATWLEPILADRPVPPRPSPPVDVPLPLPDPALAPFRAALLQQFSRAASQGLVELAPGLPRAKPTPPSPDPRMAHLQLGDTDRLAADLRTARDPGPDETATGQPCVPDDRLDIAAWGQDGRAADQMAAAWTGAVGEFDVPNAAAVTRLIRLYLYLGFGAEVRLALRALPPPGGLPDAALWQAMSHVLDGEMTDTGLFKGMLACPGSAALWAALEQPRLLPPDVDKAAVLRSFSALPPHLRRLLGPSLAERFLGGGDPETARALRDAILRAPGDPGPRTAIFEARYDLASGNAAQATDQLDQLVRQGGAMGQEALLALIDAQAQTLRPLAVDRQLVAEALFREHQNGAEAARFRRGVILARALAGDFDGAFALLPDGPENTADLWRLLAEMGPDSAILTHALGISPPPHLGDATAQRLAQRLADLGFPDAAGAFAPGAVPTPAPPAGPNPAGSNPADPAAWQAVQASLAPAPPPATAPLAEGRALLQQSAATRAALEHLLAATPEP